MNKVLGQGRIYRGEVDNYGQPDGIGTMIHSCDIIQEGQWKNGDLNGQGRCIYGDDGSWYQGGYKNSRKDGHGILMLANGDKYIGE